MRRRVGRGGRPLAVVALVAMIAAVAPSAALAQSVPQVPASVTLTRADGTITATWTAVAEATKYHVTYSSDGKKSWSLAAFDHVGTSITISGADNSKTYVVAVRAGNDHGWGGWRDSAPIVPSGPPARVGYVSLSRVDGAVTASWNSVAGATKYHVTYSSDGRRSWSLAAAAHASTSITISVQNQHAYVVAVRAGKSASGGGTLWGGWRNSWSSPPWNLSAPPPSAPASVSLDRGCYSFSLSWTPVSGATGYDVNVSHNDRKSWQRALSNVTYTTWNFSQWSKNKPYTVAVRARNGGGTSGWTNSVTVHPPPCEVGGLRSVTATVHGTAGGTITTTWNAATRATAYNVNYRADGGQWQRIASNVSATAHTGTVAGTGGHTVAVQSTNGSAMSKWRNTRAGWLTAGGIAGAGATLTLAGHSGDWHVKETSPATDAACSSSITATTHTLAALAVTTDYEYTAYRDAACADAIGSTSFTTTGPTAPAQTTGLSLASGNAQIAASWTAPSDNGEAIFDHDVHYRQTGATDWSKVSRLVTHNPGTRLPVASPPGCTLSCTYTFEDTDASTGDAISLGDVSLSGITVTKPTLTGVNDVYLLGSPVSDLRVQLAVEVDHLGSNSSNWRARYASTAPTASNMHNHGTQIWQFTASGNQTTTGNGWTGPLPSGTYFWAAATGLSGPDTIRGVTPLVQADVPLTETTSTITGLTNGTEYEVRVRAVNALGNGVWSASATLKAGLPASPAAPVLASGAGSLTATWTASGNGSAITGYDVAYCSAGCADDANWTDVTHSGTAATAQISDLANGTAYQVRVRAANSVGTGPWSSPATGIPGAPDSPTAPTLASGNAQITVAWAAPADNGSDITDYDVRYRISDTNSTQSGNQPGPWLDMPASSNSTATTATISDATNGAHPALANSTGYDVQVRAGNARGEGGWSPSASIKPGLPGKPAAPTLAAAARRLTVSWTAPTVNGLAITDYDVQYRKSTDTAWTSHPHTGTSTSAEEIDGLEAVAYQVQVRASSAAGPGPWSDSATATPNAGVPDTPAAPTLQPGSTQITASWAAPYDGGSSITDYDVRYCSSGCNTDSNWTEWNSTNHSTDLNATITGLTDGTVYQVQVRASNTNGDSGWSSSTSQAAGAPSAVGAPTLTVGDGKLTVSWTAPAQNAAAIADYDVRYRQAGTTNWTRVFDGGSTGRAEVSGSESANSTDDPIDFGGFNSPASNYFTNEALNGKGGLYKVDTAIDEMDLYLVAFGGAVYSVRTASSKPSDVSTGTVLATSSLAKEIRRWVGPFAVGDYLWAAPGGGTTYTIRRNQFHAIDLATTTTSYELGGLTNGTSYEVQVRAGNPHGDSPWSPAATASPASG